MICRGDGKEPKNLRRGLESIAPWVDSIYITLTGAPDKLEEIEAVCKEFKVNVSYSRCLWEADEKAVTWCREFFGYDPYMKVGDKLFLFDDARNFNFAQIPDEYDWVFWMDCDDTLVGGENMWKIKEIGSKANIDAFFLNYIYQAEFDDEGNIKQVVIEHLRERIVRPKLYKWIMPIHETLIEQKPTNKTDNYDCYVVHHNINEDRMVSLERNLKNLELAIYKTEGKDPRQVYYLAKAYFDLGMQGKPEYFDKAMPLINIYLYSEHKSGWPEERSQADEYLSEIYRIKKQYNNAIKAGMNALIEAPENTNIFLNIAAAYMEKNDWERSLFWAKLSTKIDKKKSTLVVNPLDQKVRLLQLVYNCSLRLGHIDEAWAAMEKLIELTPNDKGMQEARQFINHLRTQRDVTKKVVELAEYLKNTGEQGKVKALLNAVPKISEETPFVINLQQQNNPPKHWGKDEIAIFCGQGFTTWSPKKMDNPGDSFVGGSEEAVICMSREIAKLGWKVTVYADPAEDEGVHDGVTWLPYYKINRFDSFNIIVAWRNPGFSDNNFKTKKLYVWLHDIQNPLDWTPERIQKTTKVIFLSKWHRENVKSLLDDKVIISSNGI